MHYQPFQTLVRHALKSISSAKTCLPTSYQRGKLVISHAVNPNPPFSYLISSSLHQIKTPFLYKHLNLKKVSWFCSSQAQIKTLLHKGMYVCFSSKSLTFSWNCFDLFNQLMVFIMWVCFILLNYWYPLSLILFLLLISAMFSVIRTWKWLFVAWCWFV